MRIVVCGDDAVGKSSIVSSLIKSKAVAPKVKVISPITISKEDYIECIHENDAELSSPRTKNDKAYCGDPDISSTKNESEILMYLPERTILVDTSSWDMASLHMELKKADVIWLVYSDHYTYERISLHWMPMFRSIGVNLPIILGANKCDLVAPGSPMFHESTINNEEFIILTNEFKEIEACVRCSALTNYNIVEAFYLCQRAITHPISPLFDSKEGTLKIPAVSALKRVFYLCDKDQNGYLDFDEFSDLHVKCFKTKAQRQEFDEILRAVDKVIIPSASTESRGLSEDGFIILNKMYAETGRHETIWGILRAFRYSNSLSLDDKFLYPDFEVNINSSVELSPIGYKFLVDLFLKFDKDNDGGLSDLELRDLFRATPGIPKLWQDSQFPSSIVCNEEGYVSLQGWLAQWNLTTFLDHRTTLEYLLYLGFDGASSAVQALKVTKPRKRRLKQGIVYRLPVNDRNVFNCFIIGAPHSGKTSLLELFLRGSYNETYTPTIHPRMCVKDVELRGGKQCYLILEELGEMTPMIIESKARLDQCDVICYAYDSSDPLSFQYLVDLRKEFAGVLGEIPAVFVALKADLDKQQQRCETQPENYTRELDLNSPLHISSAWSSSLNELFIQLIDAAKTPSSATPGLELGTKDEDQENLKHLVMAGGALTVMTLVSVWIWRSSIQSSRMK